MCGLLDEQVECLRKPSLDFPREATELAFGTRLEEEFCGHGRSQPEPLADLTPRDIRLLSQPPQMLPHERIGGVVVHEVVQHFVVGRAADLVQAKALQGLTLDGDGCRGHAITTIIAIILIPTLVVPQSAGWSAALP